MTETCNRFLNFKEVETFMLTILFSSLIYFWYEIIPRHTTQKRVSCRFFLFWQFRINQSVEIIISDKESILNLTLGFCYISWDMCKFKLLTHKANKLQNKGIFENLVQWLRFCCLTNCDSLSAILWCKLLLQTKYR